HLSKLGAAGHPTGHVRHRGRAAGGAHSDGTRVAGGGDEGPDVELRELDDGSLALLAYTSLQALTERAGPRQPYIQVLPSAIEDIRYALGADVVLWDVALDGAVQHHVLIDEGDGHGQRDRG